MISNIVKKLFILILALSAGCSTQTLVRFENASGAERSPASISTCNTVSINLLRSLTPFSHSGVLKNFKIHLTGESGFFEKIRLVRNAKKDSDINMAYFILDEDYSSSYLIRELTDASKRGVRVNLLVDYFMSENHQKMLRYLQSHKNINVKRFRPPTKRFVKYLEHDLGLTRSDLFLKGIVTQNADDIMNGIRSSKKLKYLISNLEQSFSKLKMLNKNESDQMKIFYIYNKILNGEGKEGLSDLKRMKRFLQNFTRRMHHKYLSVETARGREVMVGGRNLSDEYHIGREEIDIVGGLLKDRKYPFIDSEVSGVFINTEQNRNIDSTFNRLWSSYSELYEIPLANLFVSDKIKIAQKIETKSTKFESSLMRLKTRAKQGVVKGRNEQEIPVKYFENQFLKDLSKKEITTTYTHLIKNAKQEVVIISAYTFLYPELLEAIKVSISKGIVVKIYTNSFETTDLNVVNLAAYKNFADWLKVVEGPGKLEIYELMLEKGKGSLHGKMIFVDKTSIGIGSANFDPRTHRLDTNNMMLLNMQNSPDQAHKIYSHYLYNDTVPWSELTLENALDKLKAIAEQNNKIKILLKLLDSNFIKEQI